MSVQEMIKSWGINLPDGDECLYLPEYLLQKHATKCYFADFFPKKISKSYAYKYNQIENETYRLICDRMYNVILKLWVYDNLYFESKLLYSKMFFKKNIKMRKLFKTMTNNCIEKEKYLSALMKLSKKNIIDLVLVFEKLHVIIVPSWSSFFVFVENDSALSLLKNIFSTEGLFLRQDKEERQEKTGDGSLS